MRYSGNLNVIIKAIDKSTSSIVRDFIELENIQSNQTSAQKFAIASYNKIKKNLIDEFSQYRGDSDLIFSDGQKIIRSKNSEYAYYIFPIDGFENFKRSNPDFTVSVALLHKTKKEEKFSWESISLVINKICANEVYFAEKGFGAFANKRRLRVPNNQSDDIVYSSFREIEKLKKDNNRLYGCKTMEIAYLAAGRLNKIFLSKSDFKIFEPFSLIAKEAGATIYNQEDQIIIGN
jgi:myo-inositol-1(or 4)-monophosphatase